MIIIIHKVKILEIFVRAWPNSYARTRHSIIIGHRMDEHVQRNLRYKYDQFLLFIRTFSSYYSLLCKEGIRRAEWKYAKYQKLSKYHVDFTLSLSYICGREGVKWINENKISRNGCSQYCVCSGDITPKRVSVCFKLHTSAGIFTVVGC